MDDSSQMRMTRSEFGRRRFLNVTGAALLAGPRGLAQEATRTVDDEVRRLAAEAPLALRFRGTTTGECRAWQQEFAARLRALLGPHAPPSEWKSAVLKTDDLDDHRRYEITLSAEGHSDLPIYLLVPKKTGRRPGILALHGHGDHGHHPVAGRDDLPGVAAAIESANYDYGRQLVRRGFVVAIPCFTPFGPRLGKKESYRGEDPCAVTFVRLQLLGKILIAENLRDALWTFEHLARRPEVDPNRLACVGLSYGGRMAMLASSLEPRIRASVISGALNVMQERIRGRYSCGAQVIPGLLAYGDVPEIGSLIAPRPCVWEVGSRDSLITASWAEEALTRMRRAYKALGAESHLLVDRFEGDHRWNGAIGIPMLEKVLAPV
jgi:dienelactone hydrolase